MKCSMDHLFLSLCKANSWRGEPLDNTQIHGMDNCCGYCIYVDNFGKKRRLQKDVNSIFMCAMMITEIYERINTRNIYRHHMK